ncbi:type II toxin-antitoxin system VapC family toxin [Caulobacter sp. BK020]|uniref:type II toxin-antitoxin system VapC family toxin n=1 Tax=Caulobacter sp. BK020 TaxID=2512117 RepID=UPI001404FB38|nr:type II toxin-antitoxin system VapC family toxin [Caulobacter sp. BK020]
MLLDTHALYWLVSEAETLSDTALVVIAEQQAAGTLYVSPITAWELGVIALKPRQAERPDLGNLTPRQWFREAVRLVGATLIPVRQTIALEAADVVATTGHKDPGDCFLIATARVKKVPIITRDRVMLNLAHGSPEYL